MELKMMKNLTSALLTCVAVALPGYTQAATINDFDLNAFDFDVVTLNNTSSCSGVCSLEASGTSNGIGWTISETNYWTVRTVTNDSFQYAALPVATDSLHASGDYTITFDSPISSLLVALSNDNQTDSINFGLTPSDSTGLTMNGTQVILDAAVGGLVLFENINSLTIQNINNNGVNDGYDFAFHAVSEVPLPAAAWLFGSALLGLAGVARRKAVA